MPSAMPQLWQLGGFGLLALGGIPGAAGDAAPSPPPVYPEYADARLRAGRAVWMGTCEGCHGYGIAGSPKIGDQAAWAPRIAKGRETLYAHALEGFFGKGSTHMPPRGGNDALSDDEVKMAVDYMVAAGAGKAAAEGAAK